MLGFDIGTHPRRRSTRSTLSWSEYNLEVLSHGMKVVGYTSRNERHRSASHRMVSARYGDHATARNDEVHLVLSVWLLRDVGADIVPLEPEAQRRHSQKLFINRSRSQFGDI